MARRFNEDAVGVNRVMSATLSLLDYGAEHRAEMTSLVPQAGSNDAVVCSV